MRRALKHGWMLILITALLCLGCSAALAEGGKVQGVVWTEKVADGMFSAENGYAGATVTLERKGGEGKAAVATAVSGKSGEFLFDDLEDGEYRLGFEVARDYHFTLYGFDSDALPAQGYFSYTPYFTVSEGRTVVRNAGVTKANVGISFVAFEDVNMNSGRMSNEPLVRSVQIEVIFELDGQEYLIASAVTDRSGEAVIRDISPGTYRVRVALPEHYVIGPIGDKISTFYNCFHPNEDGTGYSDHITLAAKETLGMGIGLVRTGSLTGKIWYDQNYNGAWDGDEPGLTDAAITLRSDTLGLSRQTQANAAGVYAFDGLQPGDYYLEFNLPDGMIFTYPGASLLTQIASKGGFNVNVQVDVTTSLGAVGAMPATSLSLLFYEDENLNGVRDEGEAGLAGVSAAADQGGVTVDRGLSDTDGLIRFSTLRGGETAISAQLPDGYVLWPDGEGLFDASQASVSGSAALTLDGEAEEEPVLSVAVTRAAAIRGILFEDPVNQGLYQAGDALLSGFTVQAVFEDGGVAATALTDEGEYLLYPLLPGNYRVNFLLNDPYVAAPYAADQAQTANHIEEQTPDRGLTGVMALAPGQIATDVNGAVFRAGTVSGLVKLPNEAGGLAGVRVTLMNEGGDPVSDFSYDVTGDDGAYLIKGVLPGAYYLAYQMPENGAFTDPMTDEGSVASDAFTSESGSEITMPTLTGVYTSVLSGVIRTDGNNPADVEITVVSQDTGKRMTVELAADGAYRFAGLRPGVYDVSVRLPEGTVFGGTENGLFSMLAADSAETTLTFQMGEDKTQADVYAAHPVSITGSMYYDANRTAAKDADEYGAEGRGLYLKGGSQEMALTTDMEGRFEAAQLPPGRYTLIVPLDENEILIGETQQPDGAWAVSVDAQSGAEVNVPVLRYASVEGAVWNLDGSLTDVSGITVALTDANGAALAAMETNERGEFIFEGLLPGEYAFTAALPEGYLFAREQDTFNRDSYIQSQPDGSFIPVFFDVPMGDALSGMDVGMGAMGQLGDRAWLDTNGNGLQDLNEPDMPGILIELYQHGQLAASAVTDGYGRYLFTSLYPGEYEMRVTMHSEIKPTVENPDFPLLNSILPQSNETTVTVPSVVVPSGGRNLHCDLGFLLRKSNVYPAAMNDIPVKDWRPYSER